MFKNEIVLVQNNTVSAIDPQVLPDGSYKNNLGTKVPCARCNRGIAKNGHFTKKDGHIFGPECVAHYDKVKQIITDESEALVIAQHQYRRQMAELTKAGMKRSKAKKVANKPQPQIAESEVTA